MPSIRIVAAAAATLAALSLPALGASDCSPGTAGCKASSIAQPGPLRLNQFIKHPAQTKVATATKPRSAQHSASKTHTPHVRLAADPVPAPAPAFTNSRPLPEDKAVASETAGQPSYAAETDGVAVTSADEMNELDAAADKVQVVAANELNELDMAADSNPATMAAVENAQPAAPVADNSWIGKLLAALGGMVAVASAARLLIA